MTGYDDGIVPGGSGEQGFAVRDNTDAEIWLGYWVYVDIDCNCADNGSVEGLHSDGVVSEGSVGWDSYGKVVSG